jgi:tetratricopeptide (TPR) repeat protein
MERKHVRSHLKSIFSITGTVALVLGLSVVGPGCGGKLNAARAAWADGEGDFEEAEPLYREAMENDRTKKAARHELAEAYVFLGQQNKAKLKVAYDYFGKALELEPDNEAAIEGMGRVMMLRGMPEEALKLVERGAKRKSCKGCKRLLTVLLIQRGDAWMAAGYFPQAETDYGRALAIIPNAAVALQIVRARLGAGNNDSAAKGLEPAASMILAVDVDQRKQFLALRRQIVLTALKEGKPELAEKLLDLAPQGVGPEEQLTSAIEVALELKKINKPDSAIDRMESIVDAANKGKLKIDAGRLDMLKELLADLYVARSSIRLSQDDIAGAEEDLARALQLQPGNNAIELQRVLASYAGKKDIVAAEAMLKKISPKTQGFGKVTAILAAAKVHQLVAAGKLDAAKVELDRAKARGGDLPEVHIALADWLAVTELSLPGVWKKDLKEVRARGLVKYPNNKITRLGEALSELDWARQAIATKGAEQTFRGPGTQKRLEELQTKLSAIYPFPVKHQPKAGATLVLTNKGAAPASGKVQRCANADAKVAPGTSSRVEIPKAGFCELTLGGKSAAFIAEPNTEVELPL